MGRKPNPLILEYFVRGPKLNDNSNRYPHTCKQCGENFPKGRIDSLTTHITKKCPAISDSDRMRACLELHGIASARTPLDRANPPSDIQANGQQLLSSLPQGWSALETLAEASRQVDLNENGRVVQKGQDPNNPLNGTNGDHLIERFELQEQFTLDHPPIGQDGRVADLKKDTTSPPSTELTPEERLQAFLPNDAPSPDPSNISVAVAATARLNPSFLDPQLVGSDTIMTSPPAAEAPMSTNESTPPTTIHEPTMNQPWGEMTYLATAPPLPMFTDSLHVPMPTNRGGVRMDTSDTLLNGKPRHARSRFNPARRKEVQQVRKIGACIRCRILRKNCGTGDPCDTCRKVLAPRVWRTGCVRTRLQEQLDLYSAGVQVVLSQNRINMMRSSLQLMNNLTIIDMSHFPETGINVSTSTLGAIFEREAKQGEEVKEEDSQQEGEQQDKEPWFQVLMIHQDGEDLPDKVEKYMRSVLPIFIEREPSKFMRITLETATQQLAEKEDDLLRKSLELWGLVESIDRERQWVIQERPSAPGQEPRYIKEAQHEHEADIYTMICMQLNAAAERKANTTSKSLLGLMHRILQDSKVKVGFNMYLTAIIFLNCVEKSTWAFKAWEQDHLRPGWPLERDPSVFTEQGDNLANLLKMLLGIRKALPQTARGDDGRLITTEQDPCAIKYFEDLELDYDTIVTRQKGSQFSPADSRSLEHMFCSHLLLPNTMT